MSPASLSRLMTLLSPTFPVGGFSYSGGLETAYAEAYLQDDDQLLQWLTGLLRSGSIRNDALLCSLAYRSYNDDDILQHLSQVSQALSLSHERYQELVNQARSFRQAIQHYDIPNDINITSADSYPVIVGQVCAAMTLGHAETLTAYLLCALTNQLQAAIRLGRLGQYKAVSLTAQLEPLIQDLAQTLINSSIDDLSSATLQADMLSLKHETQSTRMFQS